MVVETLGAESEQKWESCFSIRPEGAYYRHKR